MLIRNQQSLLSTKNPHIHQQSTGFQVHPKFLPSFFPHLLLHLQMNMQCLNLLVKSTSSVVPIIGSSPFSSYKTPPFIMINMNHSYRSCIHSISLFFDNIKNGTLCPLLVTFHLIYMHSFTRACEIHSIYMFDDLFLA